MHSCACHSVTHLVHGGVWSRRVLEEGSKRLAVIAYYRDEIYKVLFIKCNVS